jgi:DNA topoisomerase-1
MSKSLVIVESPAKAKTINKFLGADFIVKASIGHIKDLPKNKLGVDIDKDFSPDYQTLKDKKKIVTELKKAAKEAIKSGGKIFLAQDPDREGEAIAWHIAEEVNGNSKEVFRVLFHEITKRAVIEAIEKPNRLDVKKYEAQKARRVLDRLVGYQVSPILWEKVRRGLSAGRVQSVALKLICDREKEIKAFVPMEYWSINGEFLGENPPAFKAKLTKQLSSPGEAREKAKKIEIKTGEDAQKILNELKGVSYIIREIEKKERIRNPYPPFITSTLQQEASRRYGYTAKKTMRIAQQLYEGVTLGSEGAEGLITYMRTDSTRISPVALEEARRYISKNLDKNLLPDKARIYTNKKKAQDAHEAIRPSSFNHPPESISTYLDKDQFNLYSMIWNRFLACQMKPATVEQTTVYIAGGNYLFQAHGSVVKFPGFLTLYQLGREGAASQAESDGNGSETDENVLPSLRKGEALKLLNLEPQQHFTQPPPRFSESSLIKELEDKGIGRPSTYATILSNIEQREYVEREKKRYIPTELGTIVTDLLVKSFPEVIDVDFTAKMEEELDRIEEGKMDWKETMKEFYLPFKNNLEKARVEMRDIKKEQVETDILCDLCGKKMVIKWGKRGKFLACPGYPECKFTKDFAMDEKGKITIVKEKSTGEPCPKCGNEMVIKTGRFGRFMACSDYPNCKTTKPISTGVTCPEKGCGGDILERQSKKGRVFFSCSNYPQCTFSLWTRPYPEKCPHCDHPFLTEVYTKEKGNYLKCPRKECHYQTDPHNS